MKKKQPTTNSLLVVSTIRRLLKKILSGINKSQKFDFNFVQAKNVISSVRIVLSDNINFEISFVEAKTFNPSDGVEVGSQQYRKTIVFLGKKYSIKKIKSMILG